MNDNGNTPKKMLDAAIDAVRSSEPDAKEMENQAARVWARIKGEIQDEARIGSSSLPLVDQIRGCEDYRALIPAYIAGRLPSARALLVKDHTNECVACRNALNAARGVGPRPSVLRAERRFNRARFVFAAAAVLVVGIALQQAGYLNFLLPVVDVNAMARSIDGRLYRIEDYNMNPVAAGDAVKAGESIRTAAGSRAVIELADGTHIEMRERSQLSLVGTYDGVRINLDRGSVIVEAAKQRDGHLYVATDDCTVSVVGTVFAVSTGVKGSRVSVIEGEVRVARPATAEQALTPGQQMTTTPTLTPVSIEDEIAWSRNLNTHLALLRALADVNAFLRDRVPGPQLRFSSTLLSLVPVNTVMYGAFPNVSSALGQAYDLFLQRINQNQYLSAWWAEQNKRSSSTELTLEEMIGHVRSLGGHLGEEIVIAVSGSREGPDNVVVLASVLNPSGVLAEIKAIASHDSSFRVLTDPTQLAGFTGNERGPIAYIGNTILAMSGAPKAIYDVIVAQQSGNTGFAARPFYASIAKAYSEGAGTLFAADIATVFPGAATNEARFMGLSNADRVVLEQKQVSGKTMTRAQMNFSADRSGAAAWLAAPSAMGALDFVSPQAYGLASAVTKDAVTIVDEILKFVTASPGGTDELEKLQRETGIDIRRDLAEPLGGEFLLAMDGPFLPTPSWKAIFEVYDSARLQNTIERIVMQINSYARQNGGPVLTLTSEAAGGQIYYRLQSVGGIAPEIHYTYALGYFVAAPSRGLVSQALQYQYSRSSLARSAAFRSLMPADGSDYCSAILYQNLVETANSIANYVPSAVGGLTSDQLQTLKQTIELTPATLVCATGEPNRIVMGYQGDLAFNVLMLGGLQAMLQTVAR